MPLSQLIQAQSLIREAAAIIRGIVNNSPSLQVYEGYRMEVMTQSLNVISGNEDNYASNDLTLSDLINTEGIFWHLNK